MDSNIHSPVFEQLSYTVTVPEYNEITSEPGVTAGSTVATVTATDADGTGILAGQIEYRIASGHFLGTTQLFDIPQPGVS